MKIKDLIIAVLSVTVIILGIFSYSGRQRHGYDAIDDHPDGKDLFNCNLIPQSDDGDSTVDIDWAQHVIRDYQDSRFDPDIMAYHVGLEMLESMVKQANSYNTNDSKSDTIAGYRFYHAITSRTFSNLNVEGKKDLLAVPVMKNGLDYYEVYFDQPQLLEEVNMYSKFRPCPKLCADGKYVYHHK